MDFDRVAFCKKACFLASTAGYKAKLDSLGFGCRMTMVAPDGTQYAGEWNNSATLAVESCCKVFMNNVHPNDKAEKKA